MIIGMRSVLDEIQVTNCQHEAGAQLESLRLHHSWLMSKTNKIILHTRHYFKGLVMFSECYNGIDYGGKKDKDLYGTEWASQPRR